MTNAQVAAPSAQVNNSFTDWQGAGFGPDLLPIIPPTATIALGSSVKQGDRGKVPGKLHGSNWSGFARWPQHAATTSDIRSWDLWRFILDAGIGLQSRNFPGVDIDVTDHYLSDLIAMLADYKLGFAPERVGRAPKRLLTYRFAPREAMGKRRVEFKAADGSTHAVEILATGQQYVVEGTHPGTMKPYAWTNGVSPASLGAAALTPVTVAQIDDFLNEVVKLIQSNGGTVLSRSGASIAAQPVAPSAPSALQGDPAMIEEALNHIGNDFGYDDWITLCAATKAALGDDEAHYPIFESWCLLYGGNDANTARAKWDSLKPPYRVGAELIYRKAGLKGWDGWAKTWGLEDESQPAPHPVDPSEIYLSGLFAKRHQGRFRWDRGAKSWFLFDGAIWRADVKDTVTHTLKLLCNEAAGWPGVRPSLARSLGSGHTVSRVEQLAKSDPRLVIGSDCWDEDPFVLGTPDGVIDLKTGETLPTDASRYVTKSVAATPHAPDDYNCPNFLAFMNFATNGSADLHDYLQEIAGYTLLGVNNRHLLFFLYGPTGTGKTTFTEALSHAIGDYATTSQPETFMTASSDRHTTNLAVLKGFRMVSVSETEAKRQWSEGLIKQLTGGDMVAARRLYRENAPFRPGFKLLIAGNALPRIANVDGALRRRMKLVPFNFAPPSGAEDVTLPERLKAEASGILGWALAGLLRLESKGSFTEPAEVTKATAEYFDDQDLLGQWLAEQCVADPAGRVHYDDLHQSFGHYCFNKGRRAPDISAFRATLKQRIEAEQLPYSIPANPFSVSGKTSSARGVAGLRLVN